jgi:hypothetical protein
MDMIGGVIEKIRYALSLLNSDEWTVLLLMLVAYHVVIFLVFFAALRGATLIRVRALESELREVLGIEKDREISQIRAEYDAYVALLEQKLMRSRTSHT